MVYTYAVDGDLLDDLLPANNHDVDHFSSMELTAPSNARNKKREAGPFLNLIMDILETLQSATKSNSKRRDDDRYT